jgi:sugar lactone lactonase YvrE
MSNLSDLLPAGASGKKATFTASGAISNGDTVILNTDGTISVVAQINESKGSSSTFESANTLYFDSVYDTNADAIVISYADGGNGNYLTVVAGSISGSSITFGTPVVFYSFATSHTSIGFNPDNNTIAVAFQANTWGRHAVGSVSGTTVTLGGTGDFYGASAGECSIAYNIAASRWVVVVEGVSNSNYLYSYSGSGSTTSISWNGAQNIKAAAGYWPNVVYDPNAERIVILWRDGGNSNRGTAVVGEINASSTGYDYGTPVVFESGQADYPDACFDPDTNLIVVAYRDTSDSNAGKVIAGQVSGTGTGSTISFGSAVAIGQQSGDYSITYDNVNKRSVVGVRNGTNGYPYVYNVTVSSDKSISIDSGFEINTTATSSTQYSSISVTSKLDAGKIAVMYTNSTTSGDAVVYQPLSTNALPAPKFVGIAQEDIANAASGEVVLVGGIAENATSEVTTTNSTVYLQRDGSLSTTASPIEAGLAFGALSALGYRLQNASYDSKSFSVATQDSSATEGFTFSYDGTKMYAVGTTNRTVYQYDLSTAFDVSTASYASKSFSVATQETGPRGIRFKSDGTKMYIVGSTADTVFQYSLSTAWDVSTASYDSVSLSVASEDTLPMGLAFSADGTEMYMVGGTNDSVYQYTLSTAWDLSTGSYASKSLSVASQDTSPGGVVINSDGTKLFVVGFISNAVYQYNLSTAYDLSTASYASISFSVATQATVAKDLSFSTDGTKMYTGSVGTVYQYSTSITTASKLLLNG